MYRPNYCAECGASLKRKGWGGWVNRRFCDDCARQSNQAGFARSLAAVIIIVIAAFALGRYLRPAPPPLIIQRPANSPLSDLPVNVNDTARPANRGETGPPTEKAATLKVKSADDALYICGARTKKGTPCHRRVHFAGERCYQHKGMPAMLPPEKLAIKR
jgi:hypothetical protein